MEILTCPKCLNQIRTAKALQYGSDKQVKCAKCGFYHSLGVARAGLQPAQQPQVVYVERKDDGKTANMIAAIATLFIPGLGHMLLGRPLAAVGWFLCTLIGYGALVAPGIVLHVWCVLCVLRLK